MTDGPYFSDFTPAEKRRIAALTARMALPRANLTRLRSQVERIEQDALRRKSK
ncbi:hypothetical protein [Streptomyces sp. NBC_01092]|uniref:hypothetical protein n=1 Tax=Streptomyces sp. NBC_01092 TaxID=2903748 RepID=UPI00386DEA63|nr:hypothetical protein OG254_24180 [Streptomyces sp. NBC_01092]